MFLSKPISGRNVNMSDRFPLFLGNDYNTVTLYEAFGNARGAL